MARPRNNPENQKITISIEIPQDVYERMNYIIKTIAGKRLDDYLTEQLEDSFSRLTRLLSFDKKEESVT